MKNKIVWVIGPSAVGKATFIKHVQDNKPQEILSRLEWNNIIICKESLEWVFEENKHLRKDNKLDEIIVNYSKENPNSSILIKGQDVDFNNNFLEKTRNLLPDNEHEIVYLYTDFNVLYSRYKSKSWWNESLTEDVCREWIKVQLGYLKKCQEKGFQIMALDSSDNKKYTRTSFPPII